MLSPLYKKADNLPFVSRPPKGITKTSLFKYTENFTTKKWKFSDKGSDIFHISAQTKLWVLVRTASAQRVRTIYVFEQK